MFERFTDRARRVVVLAQDEARDLKHGYIGTEHLLLACAVEGEGVAARALSTHHLKDETIRAALVRQVGEGQQRPSGHIPFTPRAKKVLELALREALQLGHNYIGTEHLLLGIIREAEGLACQMMRSTGVEPTELRKTVIEILTGYEKEAAAPRPAGWEVVHPKPQPHTHTFPTKESLHDVGRGSIWRCECGDRWSFENFTRDGQPRWQPLGDNDE